MKKLAIYLLGVTVISVVALAVMPVGLAYAQGTYLTSTLTLDDSGAEVLLLQKWLASVPELYPEGSVTGEYGPATRAAVERYQERKGLILRLPTGESSYGMVGSMTRANLNSDFSETKVRCRCC